MQKIENGEWDFLARFNSNLGINFETENEHVHVHCDHIAFQMQHYTPIAHALPLPMHCKSIPPLGCFKKSWQQASPNIPPNTHFPFNYPHLHNAKHPAGFPKRPENQSDVENMHSLPSLRVNELAPRAMKSTCLLSTCQVDASVGLPLEQPKPPRFRKFAAMDWRAVMLESVPRPTKSKSPMGFETAQD